MDAASTEYDPQWNLRDGGNDREKAHASFRRLAREALVALGRSFDPPAKAVDEWLNELHDFYRKMQRTDYASNAWGLKRVVGASAEYCAEQHTRFHELGNLDAERKFKKLRKRFLKSPDGEGPMNKLNAYRRRDPDVIPPAVTLTATEPESNDHGSIAQQRKKDVESYCEAVTKKRGRKFTKTQFWKSAGYKTRTEFEKWERNDPKKVNKTAIKRFTKILSEKPDLR